MFRGCAIFQLQRHLRSKPNTFRLQTTILSDCSRCKHIDSAMTMGAQQWTRMFLVRCTQPISCSMQPRFHCKGRTEATFALCYIVQTAKLFPQVPMEKLLFGITVLRSRSARAL